MLLLSYIATLYKTWKIKKSSTIYFWVVRKNKNYYVYYYSSPQKKFFFNKAKLTRIYPHLQNNNCVWLQLLCLKRCLLLSSYYSPAWTILETKKNIHQYYIFIVVLVDFVQLGCNDETKRMFFLATFKFHLYVKELCTIRIGLV